MTAFWHGNVVTHVGRISPLVCHCSISIHCSHTAYPSSHCDGYHVGPWQLVCGHGRLSSRRKKYCTIVLLWDHVLGLRTLSSSEEKQVHRWTWGWGRIGRAFPQIIRCPRRGKINHDRLAQTHLKLRSWSQSASGSLAGKERLVGGVVKVLRRILGVLHLRRVLGFVHLRCVLVSRHRSAATWSGCCSLRS